VKIVSLGILLLGLLLSPLSAYESQDKLEVIVVGKVAKFVQWKRDRKRTFVITILNNPYEDLFDVTYKNKKIHKKKIELVYIDNIKDLKFTHILYISNSNSKKLKNILKTINKKNILVVSNIRGFAQKGGVIQVYFASRKPKLKINLKRAKKNNLKVSSSLLKIAEIVKEK